MAQPKILGTGEGKARTLFGSDGSDWHAVKVDSDGNLYVNLDDAGGFWHIDNTLFGYNDVLVEEGSVAGTGGNVLAEGSVVPSGEVWVCTQITGVHNDPAARHCLLGIDNGTSNFHLCRQSNLAQWELYTNDVWWVLKAGWNVHAQINALAIGRTGYVRAHYFKMKV